MIVFGFYALCILFITCIFKHVDSSRNVKPFIVLGGFMGSNLEVKLTNARPHDIFCLKNSDWYQLWINIVKDVRFLDVNCFVYNLELLWYPTNRSVESNIGVSVRPKDFGGLDGLRWLDANFHKETEYFDSFFNYFEINYGYIGGVNMRGASYDFRLSPNEWSQHGGFFSQLKILVEETYTMNDNQKVSLVSHSMGSPATNVFLNSFISTEWRKKYIDSFVSIAGAWDGGVSSLSHEFLVEELPSWLQHKIFGQSIQKYIAELSPHLKTLPGIQWMVPSVKLQDDVVIVTDSKNYTMAMYHELMSDIQQSEIYELYEYVHEFPKANKPPGVPTHCIYTFDVPTVVQVYIDDVKNPTTGRVTKTAPGDGTVPVMFSEMCDNFAKMQTQEVVVHKISDCGHYDLVKLKEVWEVVANIVVPQQRE